MLGAEQESLGLEAAAQTDRLAVAQADAMPTWLPGDEFAKLRGAAPATQHR